ncbi:Heavy metal-associated isoprenylated plant protein 26 [Spatholobus suberectus]|nr:Heavy metal-associated isoprenylated plant protein 26 [Spatholobus suberectus]
MEMNLSRLKTVEIKVQMDCQCLGCERKVKKSVKGMEGVTHVEVKPEQGKLTVTGFVDPDNLLERVRRRTRKKAEFWPRPDEPYGDVVPHPYAPEPYNVNALAPPGYMRNMSTGSRSFSPCTCELLRGGQLHHALQRREPKCL